MAQVQASTLLASSMPAATNMPPAQACAPVHLGVGHIAVQRRPCPPPAARTRSASSSSCAAARQPPTSAARGRQRVGGQCSGSAASSSGPSVMRGPVDQHPLRQRPRLAHPPDVVERAVDGENQRQRRDQQHDQAQPRPAGWPCRRTGSGSPAPGARCCRASGCRSASAAARPETWRTSGKAVNTASATVKKGTSAMVVVKVRLLAVRPSRSSRKRSRRVGGGVPPGKARKIGPTQRAAKAQHRGRVGQMPWPL